MGNEHFKMIDKLKDYIANIPSTLEELREKVPDELEPYVNQFKGKLPWMVLQHPFCYSIPFHGGDGEIASVMENIETKKRIVSESDGSGKPWESIWMYERPWRLSALVERKKAWPKDSMSKFYETLGAVWIDSENIHQNKEMWCVLLTEAVKVKAHRDMMDSKDFSFYSSLAAKEEVTLYRGASSANKRGFSWTSDIERAQWFARRFSQRNGVWMVKANILTDAVAAFVGRSESEVVLSPNFIKRANIVKA